MPLSAGTKLGPYGVTSLLGQGGMGEVCRGMVDSEDSRGLVLALIEEPALTDRIEAGSISPDEASSSPVNYADSAYSGQID